MAKVKITKTIVTKTPQLAEVLAEKGFKVGDEVEKDQLDELVNIANTSELKELTEADFEAEPALADSGLKVGDKVRILKDVEDSEGSEVARGEDNEKGDKEQNSELNVKQPKAPKAEKQPSKPKEKPRYKAISDFLDKNDNSVIYKVGDEVPENFEAERIEDLIDRGLIQQI